MKLISNLDLVDHSLELVIAKGDAQTPQRFWDRLILPKGWVQDEDTPFFGWCSSGMRIKGNPYYTEEALLKEVNYILKDRKFTTQDYATDVGHSGGGGYGQPPRVVFKKGLFIKVTGWECYHCSKESLFLSFRQDKDTGVEILKNRSSIIFQGEAREDFNLSDLKQPYRNRWLLIQKGLKQE